MSIFIDEPYTFGPNQLYEIDEIRLKRDENKKWSAVLYFPIYHQDGRIMNTETVPLPMENWDSFWTKLKTDKGARACYKALMDKLGRAYNERTEDEDDFKNDRGAKP